MPTSPECKPWCAEHSNIGENSCTRLICLYTSDDEARDENSPSGPKEADPQIAALREQLQTIGGFPDQVDTVFLYVSQDLEEDDYPLMTLRFWDSSKDEDSAHLQIDIAGLEYLRAGLGSAIKIFR